MAVSTRIPTVAGSILSQWPSSARLAFNLGVQRGMTPQAAADFAASQYGESSFNPNARNPSSGAAGLYQLLSPGYVNTANRLGGVYNPRANILAILPNYLHYYRSHPFVPGAAAASVEASGKGAQYYAQGYQHLPGIYRLGSLPNVQTLPYTGQPRNVSTLPYTGQPATAQLLSYTYPSRSLQSATGVIGDIGKVASAGVHIVEKGAKAAAGGITGIGKSVAGFAKGQLENKFPGISSTIEGHPSVMAWLQDPTVIALTGGQSKIVAETIKAYRDPLGAAKGFGKAALNMALDGLTGTTGWERQLAISGVKRINRLATGEAASSGMPDFGPKHGLPILQTPWRNVVRSPGAGLVTLPAPGTPTSSAPGYTPTGPTAAGIAANPQVQAAINAAIKAHPLLGPNAPVTINVDPSVYQAKDIPAHLLTLPSNIGALTNQALKTILDQSGFDYNAVLAQAMKDAYGLISPQLTPIEQQAAQNIGTVKTYAQGAQQLEQQIAGQVGDYFTQAANQTKQTGAAVNAMLNAANPAAAETYVDPAQQAQLQAQAQETFAAGGAGLAGATQMGIQGLAADRAATLSYAAMLPSIFRTQTTQALSNIAAQTAQAEAKVLAGVPTLATKMASGQLQASKAAQQGAKDFLDWATGARKFNLTQLSARDKANQVAFGKAVTAAISAGQLKLSGVRAAETARHNAETEQNAAVKTAIAKTKALYPSSATATQPSASTSKAWDSYWQNAFNGKTQRVTEWPTVPGMSGGGTTPPIDPKTNRPATDVQGKPLQPKTTTRQGVGALNFNDAVAQFHSLYPAVPMDQVVNMASTYYRSIGYNGRPLDPIMEHALSNAGLDLQLNQSADNNLGKPLPYLSAAQMAVLLNDPVTHRAYVYPMGGDNFQILSTGQTITATPDTRTGQIKYWIDQAGANPAAPISPTPGSQSTPAQQGKITTRSFVTPNGTQVEVQGRATAKDLAVVQLAAHFIGTPYSWGGGNTSGPSYGIAQGANIKGFDCSSLIQYVWAQKGVSIGRTTYEQYQQGVPVSKSQLRPGDAVFFTGADPQGGLPGHVGLYIGGGKFIEAPYTGADIRISNLAGRKDYVGARRYDAGGTVPAGQTVM